jgi:integrase
MTVSAVLDAAGRRRSPATRAGYHAGRSPRNKGMRYPADPPTVEEIVAVMRKVGTGRHGARLRALIVVLWRGGLRIQEALALTERDLDPRRGSLLVRHGKGGRRREVGMDEWGLRAAPPLAGRAGEAADRPAVLRDRRPDARASVVWGRGARRVPPSGRRSGHKAPLRSAPTTTRARARAPAKAFRSTSSSDSSVTPTSARPRSTFRASTPRRSSPPSTQGERR